MAWVPISKTPIQFEDSNGNPYSGAVLKFYQSGTSTNLAVAYSQSGTPTVTSVALNASGFPVVSGNVVIIYVDQDYKVALYPTQAAADSDTGAIWTVDAIDFDGEQNLPAILTTIAGLAVTDGNFLVGNGSTWVVESGNTARTSLGLGTGDSPTFTGVSLSGITEGYTLVAGASGAVSGVNTATKGNIVVGDGSGVPSALAVGTDGYVLTADAAQSTGVKWAAQSGFAYGLKRGLTLSNNSTDSDHDIDVEAGHCADSGDALILSLSAITKRIDATWASGTGNGGLASGASLGNNTWYHVFVVRVGGSNDVMFDTSVTCANGVANNSVTHYRRIGSVRTDGSANITGFIQHSDQFYWKVPTDDVTAVTPGTSAVTAALTVPPDVRVMAQISAIVSDADAGSITLYISATDTTDSTASDTGGRNSLTKQTNGVEGTVLGGVLFVLTNTSRQFRYRLNQNADTVYFGTQGWKEYF